jgi:flagellar M-ring protein FliF
MPDRIKKILDRIVDWWKKFTRKQKTLIGSICAAVVIAIGILAYVLSRPDYMVLTECDTTTEAAEIIEVLEDAGIDYTTSSDGKVISVLKKDEAEAHLTLGSNDIPSSGYDIEDVFDGSFSTTESDKQKKYQLYLQEKIAGEIEDVIDAVDSAKVNLSIPDNDGTLLSQQEDTYASVMLRLNTELEDGQAQGLAQYIATAVGNEDTDNILILDSSSNVLFCGADSDTTYGNAASQQEFASEEASVVKAEVKDVFLGSGLFDNVQVGLNLSMSFDEETQTREEYDVADDRTEGYLDSQTTYTQETEGGTASTPGTDSNDEDTYVIDESDESSEAIEEVTSQYLPNKTTTVTSKGLGGKDLENSSITVVATRYVTYSQELMEENGTLGEQSFEEYAAENDGLTEVEVDDDFYSLVSNATGIPEANITIKAYEKPFFEYTEASSLSINDYLQYVLAFLILVMLGFVVFRSTRGEATAELEPELSVESLLETTMSEEDEVRGDIGYTEKSETRLIIEKFVDENPEAAASLLRNWLNEDWE